MRVIRWARRSLYLLLFILLAVARWDQPFTIGVVGAAMIAVYLGLYLANDQEAWEELDDLYLVDIIAGEMPESNHDSMTVE